ncbi:MAG: glutamine synthetase adenylyl-L-tyrosine phosphorylase/ Glutamate-ammonia-ligase adenylyltransferase [Nitrospira sp.]|jgi:glutamate-ammonia-ligase adenylyltransferase|nr:MAG: glutamine synthetase adenylyl-L-tyrosine phosphorylase/ Glutamate-ammonia-ligase adenylyltransferase [Nitrospira sp.]
MEGRATDRELRGRGGQSPLAKELPDPTPLLVASGLDLEQVSALLSPFGIAKPAEADANIQSMAGEPHTRKLLATILPNLLAEVARTADPDQALNHWERLVSGSVNRSSLLRYLQSSPKMLGLLCTIFGNSDSLAFALIRDPMLVYWLAEENVLSTAPTRAGMVAALHQSLGSLTSTELKLDVLRRVRRREMLRIGVRDLFRLATVEETTGSLSDLASVLIHTAYEIVDQDLKAVHGTPMHRQENGQWVETEFSVIGMGKLGAHELNYSSDVDLIYVYASAEGETRKGKGGRQPHDHGLSNEEYFEILARSLTKALAEQTREGAVFRVDLRLRAEGTVGQLARSVEAYARYYAQRGQVWERLALLKAWPIAGSDRVGQSFVRMAERFIFQPDVPSLIKERALAVIRDVRSVKEMIDEKIAGRGHQHRNVKLGTGGIREIEFLVQTIQVLVGRTVPDILDRGTVGALERLCRHRFVEPDDQRRLTEAYWFLRDVEHKLQMMHDLQTHALPDSDEELQRCAIRMGYGTESRATALAKFREDRARHTAIVNELFRSLFYHPDTSPLFAAMVAAVEGHLNRRRSGAEKETGPAGPPPDRSSTAKRKRKP